MTLQSSSRRSLERLIRSASPETAATPDAPVGDAVASVNCGGPTWLRSAPTLRDRRAGPISGTGAGPPLPLRPPRRWAEGAVRRSREGRAKGSADVSPACSRPNRPCQGLLIGSSGLVKGKAQADGQHAGMGGDHQSDQDFGLVDHGIERKGLRPFFGLAWLRSSLQPCPVTALDGSQPFPQLRRRRRRGDPPP